VIPFSRSSEMVPYSSVTIAGAKPSEGSSQQKNAGVRHQPARKWPASVARPPDRSPAELAIRFAQPRKAAKHLLDVLAQIGVRDANRLQASILSYTDKLGKTLPSFRNKGESEPGNAVCFRAGNLFGSKHDAAAPSPAEDPQGHA
jgi:hypothetical protein